MKDYYENTPDKQFGVEKEIVTMIKHRRKTIKKIKINTKGNIYINKNCFINRNL